MKNQSIPPEDHVMRYVAWGRLRKDEDDLVLGCLPQALQLREGEGYLSVSWLEHFDGTGRVQLENMARAFAQSFQVNNKAAFAKGNVGAIHEACQDHATKVRILHEPSAKNSGHSAIRRLPNANADLLAVLASSVFTELHRARDLL